MAVEVRRADKPERRFIEGLLQFYFYDFSEMEPAASPSFEFDARGRFPPLPDLSQFWRLPGCHALLIETDGRPAGFALLNTVSHRGGTVEHNMGEFFVARKHRRRGVASAAIAKILKAYSGRWEVAVVERNAAAKIFWPRAIAAAENVTALKRVEGDGEHWRGPIWTFLAL